MTDQSDKHTTETALEAYAEGVTREWLYDHRRIVIYSLPSPARKAIDVWYAVVLDTLQNWPAGQLMYSMHDLSSTLNVLTPYAQHKASELEKNARGLDGYQALIFPRSVGATFASIFIRAQLGKQRRIVRQVFYDRDSGLKWLVDNLHDTSSI